MRAARAKKSVSYKESSSDDARKDAESVSSAGEVEAGSESDDDELSNVSEEIEEEKTTKNKNIEATGDKSKLSKGTKESIGKKTAATGKSPKNTSAAKPAKVNGDSRGSSNAAASQSASSSSSMMAGVDITQGPPITNDSSAKKLIHSYMKSVNRPFSAIQIFDNLHKRIPKATLDRVLTAMSGEGGETVLLCKEYGKNKIYFMNQQAILEGNAAGRYDPERLENLQMENDASQETRQREAGQLHALQTELQSLLALPKDDDWDDCIAKMQGEVKQKQERLAVLMGHGSGGGATGGRETKKSNKASTTDMDSLIAAHDRYRKGWQDRKLMATDFLEVLLESEESTGGKKKGGAAGGAAARLAALKEKVGVDEGYEVVPTSIKEMKSASGAAGAGGRGSKVGSAPTATAASATSQRTAATAKASKQQEDNEMEEEEEEQDDKDDDEDSDDEQQQPAAQKSTAGKKRAGAAAASQSSTPAVSPGPAAKKGRKNITLEDEDDD